MKKVQLLFSSIILAMGITACSSSTTEIIPEKEFKNAEIEYEFSTSSDVLEVADVTITYTDATGKEVTEKMTTTSWKKELTSTEVPFASTCTVTATRNDQEATKASYELNYEYSNDLSINYTDGEDAALNEEASSSSVTVSKENLSKLLPKTFHFSYKIVKDGDSYKGVIVE